MKQAKYYNCEYCRKDYIPKRRGIQKYCSNSCRSNACRVRKAINTKIDILKPIENKVSSQSEKQMSLAGVGNATTGALIADGLKTLLTRVDNRPATKGDLRLLIEKLSGRYHLVKNLSININGEYPYYDLVEQKVVYIRNVSTT